MRKVYSFFALLWANQVYIGKTTSCRVSAVYHRHSRGEMQLTRECALENPSPTLCLLEIQEMQAYEAYTTVLAYLRLFENNGFVLLNSQKMITQSRALHSIAQDKYSELTRASFEEILKNSLVQKPADADRKHVPEQPAPRSHQEKRKLTVRIPRQEKEAFDVCASGLGMTQEKLLSRMINKFLTLEGGDHFQIEQLKSKLAEHKKKAEEQQVAAAERTRTLTNRLKNYDQFLKSCQNGLAMFFEKMQQTSAIPLSIEQSIYGGFPNVNGFSYPESEGPFLFRPTAILLGRGRYPARFLVGSGENGKLLKFRYYANGSLLGVSMLSPRFGKKGTLWIVGAKKAPDGAVDLAYAFPLDVEFRANGMELESDEKRYVAGIIREVDSYDRT